MCYRIGSGASSFSNPLPGQSKVEQFKPDKVIAPESPSPEKAILPPDAAPETANQNEVLPEKFQPHTMGPHEINFIAVTLEHKLNGLLKDAKAPQTPEAQAQLSHDLQGLMSNLTIKAGQGNKGALEALKTLRDEILVDYPAGLQDTLSALQNESQKTLNNLGITPQSNELFSKYQAVTNLLTENLSPEGLAALQDQVKAVFTELTDKAEGGDASAFRALQKLQFQDTPPGETALTDMVTTIKQQAGQIVDAAKNRIFQELSDSPMKTRIFSQGMRLNSKEDLEVYTESLFNREGLKDIPADSIAQEIQSSTQLSASQKEMALNVLANTLETGDFKALLDNGTLLRADSQGKTILERLHAMVNQPRHPQLGAQNISQQTLLDETLEALSSPASVMQQGAGKGTCGACTMEYMLALHEPAEFVRMAEALTSTTGQVTLRDGKALTLPENSIPGDQSGRTHLDRMLQSAIMHEANLMGADYDNPSDDGGFIAVLGGNSAIPQGNFAELYGSITGRPMNDSSSYLWGEAEVAAQIQGAVARGEDVPVMMTYGGAMAYHWLTVHEVNYGPDGKPESVVMRNPWGQDNGGDDPPRTAVNASQGMIRMSWDDFVARLDGAVLPGDLQGRPITSESMPVQARVDAINELMSGYTNADEERDIRDMLLDSSPQDMAQILGRLDLDDLESELDEADLVAVMKKMAQNGGVGQMATHLKNLLDETDDDATLALMTQLSDRDLRALAASPAGRQALEVAWDNLDSGWTNAAEKAQMNRIKRFID